MVTADDATGYSGTPPTDTATTLDGGAAASSTPVAAARATPWAVAVSGFPNSSQSSSESRA